MDHKDFDALARSAAGAGTTRRAALRLSSGGLLGLLAARFGPTEVASAKKKRKRCKTLRQTCAGAKNKRCCSPLGCGDNGCDGGNVCFQHEGEAARRIATAAATCGAANAGGHLPGLRLPTDALPLHFRVLPTGQHLRRQRLRSL
jgi:hypothetical protein